ncbi:MAG: tRNA uridine-5-carboxymethylaminomethyl(34) synthesis GTPase MnmE [Gammaproteobacteria bacterium]|nr:tRNA uridine-5-carboxymethylaminomethyl(34) synthesis GTPase MnmE [Gammaproteobacteria bacterium]
MKRRSDTIAAIATAPGASALGVVRISGPHAARIAGQLAGPLPKAREAALRIFRDTAGEALDQGLVLYFPGPASFTGEDVVELQGHGNPVVLGAILKATLDAGARPARPGEFTQRAFLNGKLDLLQAESLADLVASGSERAARSALAALRGGFSRELDAITAGLRAVRAEVEATIDFADEDLDAADAATLAARIAALRIDIARLLRGARHGARLNEGADAAIVGRPNVGKSTLLNALARDEKAIVSDEPGTTRDVLSIDLAVHGVPLRLHDTAGIREAGGAIEREGVVRAQRAAAAAELILHVVDSATAHEVLTDLMPPGAASPTVIRVHNKIDLDRAAPAVLRTATGIEVRLSAATGEGLDLLREVIVEAIGLSAASDSPYLARTRHVAALETADAALAAATHAEIPRCPELVAERLRLAQQALEEMTGRLTTEDLLDDIFSRFCLGK